MSYKAPQGPRWIFGLAGGAILGLFVLILIATFGPQLFEAYQIRQIEKCEAEHKLLHSDKSGLFGFDAGGWKVVGDNERKRGFIRCLQDRLDVRTASESDDEYPFIEIWEFSFSYGLDLAYFPSSLAEPGQQRSD